MSIRESLEYIKIDGSKNRFKLRVFALSTCGFCEKALEWLKKSDYKHEYVFIDQIPLDQKKALKEELKGLFGPIAVFPVLTINDQSMLNGFTEEKWIENLEL